MTTYFTKQEAEIKFHTLGGKYDRKLIVKRSQVNSGYAIDQMINTGAWYTLRHQEGYQTFAAALEDAAKIVKELS